MILIPGITTHSWKVCCFTMMIQLVAGCLSLFCVTHTHSTPYFSMSPCLSVHWESIWTSFTLCSELSWINGSRRTVRQLDKRQPLEVKDSSRRKIQYNFQCPGILTTLYSYSLSLSFSLSISLASHSLPTFRACSCSNFVPFISQNLSNMCVWERMLNIVAEKKDSPHSGMWYFNMCPFFVDVKSKI